MLQEAFKGKPLPESDIKRLKSETYYAQRITLNNEDNVNKVIKQWPYRGYTEVELQFPETMTGVKQSISVLALVCPKPSVPKHVLVLIGTNASIFQRLAQLCKKSNGVDIASTMPVNLQISTTPETIQRVKKN